MLGTLIQSALASVGISQDLVESWLGRPCGCRERAEKLNQLTLWAKSIPTRISSSRKFLYDIMGFSQEGKES